MADWTAPYDLVPLDVKQQAHARALIKDDSLDHEKLCTYLNTLGRLKQYIAITNYNIETKDVRFVLLPNGAKPMAFKEAVMPYCVSVTDRPIYSMPLTKFIGELLIPFGGKPSELTEIRKKASMIRHSRVKPVSQETIDSIEDTIETLDLPLKLVNPEAGKTFLDFRAIEAEPPLDARLQDVLVKHAEPHAENQMFDPQVHRISSTQLPAVLTVLDMLVDEKLNGKPDNKVKSVKIKYDLRPLLAPEEERSNESLLRISHRCRDALIDIREYAAQKGLPQHSPAQFYMIQRDVYRYGSVLSKDTDIGMILVLPPELRSAIEPINREPIKRYGQITVDMREHADTLIRALNEYVNKLPAKDAKKLYETIQDSVSVETQKSQRGK